jgi:hypothetical protein
MAVLASEPSKFLKSRGSYLIHEFTESIIQTYETNAVDQKHIRVYAPDLQLVSVGY